MLGVKPAQRAPDPPGAAEGCEHPAAALQGSHAAMKWDPGAIHPPCPIPGQQLEMARTRRTSMPTRPDCSSPPGAFGSFESSSTRLNLPERKGLCVRGIRARAWETQPPAERCGCSPQRVPAGMGWHHSLSLCQVSGAKPDCPTPQFGRPTWHLKIILLG